MLWDEREKTVLFKLVQKAERENGVRLNGIRYPQSCHYSTALCSVYTSLSLIVYNALSQMHFFVLHDRANTFDQYFCNERAIIA